MKLRVMSMNVRYSRGKDGKNIWINRKALVEKVLKKYTPDLIGFQEPLLDQMQDIVKMLPEYQYVGVGREDGQEEGEFNPIFSKNMSIEQSGTFWLSDSPRTPGCTWGGQTRICTWAVIESPVSFAFFNTHVEYEFLQTQINSMELLMKKIQDYAERMPVVLVGDFNYIPNSQPYRMLAEYMRDSYLEDPRNQQDNCVTSHSFTGTKIVNEHSDKGRIDYIWLKGDVQVERSCIIVDQPGDDLELYPSDHWPILADLII